MVGIPVSRRDSSDASESFTDMDFGFLEEFNDWPGNSTSWSSDDEMDDENRTSFEDKKAFWEVQDQLLQATLYRTSSIETKIRNSTKEVLREVDLMGMQCVCRRPVADSCGNCLRREICNRLRDLGFNCVICKSKWKNYPDIPSGEHTYLEVIEKSNAKKEVRVVIELNFRAEFEMARSSDEYKRLISRLPEVYVGKTERLQALIKILCAAVKKCMKEKKMHLGPWRKHKYMQAKWLGTCERLTPALLQENFSDQPPRPRDFIQTFDVLENFPGLHCSAIKVI